MLGKMDDVFEEPRRRRNSSYNKKKETNNQEQSGDIPDADVPVVPWTYKETEELLKDPTFANKFLWGGKDKKNHYFDIFVCGWRLIYLLSYFW